MAGFWPLSFTQCHDRNGLPLIGARAAFFAAGTTTPIIVYRDYGLSVAHPNPLVSDGNGLFPAVYFDEADEFYRFRLTTASGVVLSDSDGIPIIGPTSGGGGGGDTPVDPDALMQTGEMMMRYGAGSRSGFVRANARSIGTAISGATERANSDTQPLYEFLWQADATLPVGGGRGGSATADFLANKPLTLPDLRGRALFGTDDMGNTAAGRIATGSVAAGSPTVLGSSGGLDGVTLSIAQMPSHDHGGATEPAGAHSHTVPSWQSLDLGTNTGPVGGYWRNSGTASTTAAADHTHDIDAQGGGASHPNMSPFILCTFYVRL